MRKWTLAVLLVAALLAAVFFLLLRPTPVGSAPEVRVGVVCELTGEAAAWGTDLKEGIDLAIEQVNKGGGVRGKLLRPFTEDSAGSPRVGATATMKLLTQDRIEVMLGVAVSTVANAMIPILRDRQILFISGGASSPSLTGISPYFFRTWPSDLEEALVAARVLRKEGIGRVAVVRANDDYGVGLAQPFSEEFTHLGGTVLTTISFEKGAGDFKVQIANVKAASPEIIFLAGPPRDMAQIIKQLRQAGAETPVFSVSGIKEQEVLQIAGAAAEGVRFVDASFDPDSDRPETRNFMATFVARYDKNPGVLAASGYDSVLVLVEALRRANTTRASDLRSALLSLHGLPGAVGPISFSEDGNIHRPVRLSVIRGGAFLSTNEAVM